MGKFGYIYQIRSKRNKYIGMTMKNPQKRYKEHLKSFRKYISSMNGESKFYTSYYVLVHPNHEFKIIEKIPLYGCDEDRPQVLSREAFHIRNNHLEDPLPLVNKQIPFKKL